MTTKLLSILAAVLLAATTLFAQSPTVEKVEPPNWWAGHSISTVRLLVRGSEFQGARVSSKTSALKVSNVRVNERGDYLFFDVAIAKNTPTGKYGFDVVSKDGKTSVPFEISEYLDPKSTLFGPVDGRDVVYLIMTDRFSDGDRSNNKNVDRANPRMWHGGDFKGIEKNLPYLKELGVSAIWLTPWYDNSDEVTTCDKPWCPMASYHGYGSIDHYGVENHFGSMSDLRRMIVMSNISGIKVIQDQVFNHVGFRHPWMKNPPLANWFTPWEQTRFNNSSLLSPNSPKSEIDNTLKGWFDFTLPDMNYDEPEVERYQIQNALWWIEMTGIDGIRQDTIQYVPRRVIRNWSEAILKQYPKFYLVGEVFERDSAHTAFFQGGTTGWDKIDTKLPSVFDFKLWETSQEVFTGRKPVRALRDVLKYDGLYGNPLALTVLQNNHDTDRFMSLPGATLEGAMLHTAFVLTTRGIPQLYYGEELAMTGGHDPDNRKDFPGGFAGDARSAFSKDGRTADERKMFEWTRHFIKLRRNNPALHSGATVDLFYDDEAYVFMRKAASSSALHSVVNVIVAFNRSDQPRTFSIKRADYGVDLIDAPVCDPFTGGTITSDDKELRIVVPAKSVAVCSGYVKD